LSIARLFAGALVAVLLAACGPDWDSVDPSLGGAATTSNTTTGTTTSGTGGSGQTTTTPMCSSASQCPGTDSTCATRTCISGACGVSYATSGTHCGSQGSGRHCDGMGNCN
jgi:hypothetical protein